MDKINLYQIQEQINSRQLKEPEPRQISGAPSKNVMWRLWEVMQEMYGHTWNSQYGDEPTETWERLLTGISPEQIKDGLERLKDVNNAFPPSGPEFRALCLPVTTSPDGNNTAAYLSFDDPKHPRNDPNSPEYVKPTLGISSDEHVSKRKAAGRAALADIKNNWGK